MKTFMTLVLLMGILSIAMSLAACQSQTPELTTPTAVKTTTSLIQSPSPALETTAQPSPTTAQVQLTGEEKLKIWEEKGSYNAETLEEASRIAGFTVVVPSYLPEGFERNRYILVLRLGGGLPDDMKPKFSAVNVQQIWKNNSDSNVGIMLTQSQHKFGIGGDQEQVEIEGLLVTRSVTKTEPQRPNVTYAWEKDGFYFSLFGYLEGTLNEAVMEKILGSISSSLD
jgi:hypothetical protein